MRSNGIIQTQLVCKARPTTLVVGVGDAGKRVARRLVTRGVSTAPCVTFDSADHPLNLNFTQTELVEGKPVVSSSTSLHFQPILPTVQETAALLVPLLDNFDVVIITAGLGGGSGFGIPSAISRLVRRNGSLAVGAITITPESFNQQVFTDLSEFRRACDVVLLFDMPEKDSTEQIATIVGGLSELISTSSLMGIRLEDFRQLMATGDTAVVGSATVEELKDLSKIFSRPCLERCLQLTRGALVHLHCGPEVSLSQLHEIIRALIHFLPQDSYLLWGSTMDHAQRGVRVTVALAGLSFDSVLAQYAETMEMYELESEAEEEDQLDLELELDQMETA